MVRIQISERILIDGTSVFVESGQRIMKKTFRQVEQLFDAGNSLIVERAVPLWGWETFPKSEPPLEWRKATGE